MWALLLTYSVLLDESFTFKYLLLPSDELLLVQPCKKVKKMIHEGRIPWDFSARVL